MYQRLSSLAACLICCLMLTGCSNDDKFEDFDPDKVEFSPFANKKLSKEQKKLKKSFEEKLAKGMINEIDTPTYLSTELIITLGLETRIEEKLKKIEADLAAAKDKVVRAKASFPFTTEAYVGSLYELAVTSGSLLSYESDGVRKRDLKTMDELLYIKTGDEIFTGSSLSMQDKRLVTDSQKGMKIWSLETGELLNEYIVEDVHTPRRVVVNNGRIFYLANDVMTIVDLNTGDIIGSLFGGPDDYFSFLEVSDEYIVLMKHNARSLQVYSSKTYEHLREVKLDRAASALHIHGDHLLLPYEFRKGYLALDLKTGRPVGRMSSNRGDKYNKGILVHKNIVVSHSIKGLHISDFSSGKLLAELELPLIKKMTSNQEALFIALPEELRRIEWAEIEKILFLQNQQNELAKIVESYERLKRRVDDSEEFLNSSQALDMVGLEMKHTYKYGKLGERYVPFTTTSYSTPNYETTYINGTAYTQTTYEDSSYSSGGYNEEVRGYKAVYRLDNSSENYYFVRLNLAWSGKYSSYETYEKGGMWTTESGTGSKLVSSEKNSSTFQAFMLAPEDNFKFQFEVGEEEADITLQSIKVRVIPKQYYDALQYAMDENNEEIDLLMKFYNDSKIGEWRPKIKEVISNIQAIIDDRFDKKYREDASVSLQIDEKKYDRDFYNDVELEVKSKGQPMCVHIKTPFGKKHIDTSETESGFLFGKKFQTTEKYRITGTAKDDLNVEISEVSEKCSH